MGRRQPWQGWTCHRDVVRAHLPGYASRLHSYGQDWSVPELRGFPWYRTYHDGSICEVCQDGASLNDYLFAALLTFYPQQAKETTWRQPVGSLNYVETSTWTRQEHNGFSHQNPSFIGAVLQLKPACARVYLPPDANCFLSTMAHCLRAKDYVNLMVGSKQPTPVWLSPEEADRVRLVSKISFAHVLT